MPATATRHRRPRHGGGARDLPESSHFSGLPWMAARPPAPPLPGDTPVFAGQLHAHPGQHLDGPQRDARRPALVGAPWPPTLGLGVPRASETRPLTWPTCSARAPAPSERASGTSRAPHSHPVSPVTRHPRPVQMPLGSSSPAPCAGLLCTQSPGKGTVSRAVSKQDASHLLTTAVVSCVQSPDSTPGRPLGRRPLHFTA